MKKRILAFLLSAALAGALLPAALAQEAQTRVSPAVRTAPERAEPVLLFEGTEDGPAQALDAAPDYAGATEALRLALLERKTSVSLLRYNIPGDQEAIATLIGGLRNRYGELFAFTGGGGYAVNQTSGNLSVFLPEYTDMTDEEYAQAKTFYNETLDAIVAQVPENASEVEKVLFIHDYLASHYAYDQRVQLCNRDAYSFLKEGVGVCQAYSLTFSALMDRLNIPVTYVESESLNHIWNAVELEGKWYHVDVTWDDPLVNGVDVPGAAGHDYFLLSDETNQTLREAELENTRQALKETLLAEGKTSQEAESAAASLVYDPVYGQRVTCDDGGYETGVYAQADSPVVYVPGDDAWYYLSTDKDGRGLYRVARATGAGVQIAEYSPNYYGGVAALAQYQGSLFYADPKRLYRYELDTDTPATLLTIEGEQRLSGFRLEEGALSYKLLTRTEREDGTVETVETMTDFDQELLPYHEAMGGAFSCYYNFGGVGVKRGADSAGQQLLLAWFDPVSGMMKRLAVAQADGVYGEAVTDKDLTCAAFLLRGDGSLTPLWPKATIHEGASSGES